MKFFVGMHQPSDAHRVGAACISINRLRSRRSAFPVVDWIMDSGAFTELSTHGAYRHSVAQYADAARRWVGNGNLMAVVAQDYMCEPFILAKTGLTVADHQRLTIDRYDDLLSAGVGTYIMPVLQGFAPADYARHVRGYGARLAPGAWVGVGSVCKRQGDPMLIAAVLDAVLTERPDLRLHGFGVKISSLTHSAVRRRLLLGGQHGLVIRRAEKGRRREQLARGCRFRGEGQPGAHHRAVVAAFAAVTHPTLNRR